MPAAAGAPGAGSGTGAGDGSGAGSAGNTNAGSSILSGGGSAGAGGSSNAGAGAGQSQGGDASAGAGAGSGQGAGAGAAAGWNWADGVAGQGDRPTWFKADKYQTVEKQAAAAVELERKLGPAAELIGPPQGDYVLPPVPQGVTGSFDPKDPLLAGFTAVAKEMGLSQKAYDRVVQHMGSVLAQQTSDAERSVADAIAKLGANVPQRITAVQTYVTKTLGAPAFEALDAAVGTNVAAFQALEQLVAKAAGDAGLAQAGGTGGLGYTKADIEAERYKVFPEGHKLKGKLMYDHDTEHRKKVDGMWKNLFPGEDRQAIG